MDKALEGGYRLPPGSIQGFRQHRPDRQEEAWEALDAALKALGLPADYQRFLMYFIRGLKDLCDDRTESTLRAKIFPFPTSESSGLPPSA